MTKFQKWSLVILGGGLAVQFAQLIVSVITLLK